MFSSIECAIPIIYREDCYISSIGIIVNYDVKLETHKEIPRFFGYPVYIRSGIFSVIGMTTHK